MNSKWKWGAALLLAIACDSSPDRDNNSNRRDGGPRADAIGGDDATMGEDATLADASGMDASEPDSGMLETVPEPGDQPSFDWTDVEPNNSPGTAVPSGLLSGALWMGFGSPVTTINSDTDTDFFVFKTGDANSLQALFQICWSPMINLLDMYIYTVEGGHIGPLVKMAISTDAQCETLFTPTEAAMTLTAMTTYLLEVRAAPGLMLGANSGVYGA